MDNDGKPNMRGLSRIERKTYNFIKGKGEIQTINIPNKRMRGAVARLKNMGLIRVFKKYTSYYRKRKKKFVKIK